MDDLVFDVTDADFEQRVIARSHEVPVLVDFWAPWCGPCRALGPALEAAARRDGGTWVLAKLNTDENPGLAQDFRIQSIPHVKAFRGGALVDEFTGALPPEHLEAFLERIRPSAADLEVAEAEADLAAGRVDAARATLEAVVAAQPNHDRAIVALAELELAAGDRERALDLLERVVEAGPLGDRVRSIRARARLGGDGGASLAELSAKVAASPDDLETAFTYASAAAAAGEHAAAADALLGILTRDRGFRGGEAHRTLLDVLTLMGPAADPYRRRMASILFS